MKRVDQFKGWAHATTADTALNFVAVDGLEVFYQLGLVVARNSHRDQFIFLDCGDF